MNRYERVVLDNLLDILENENLKSAPAGRSIKFDDEHSFAIVAKLFGEEIVLSWHDDKGECFITVTDWKKRLAATVELFATAVKGVVEN